MITNFEADIHTFEMVIRWPVKNIMKQLQLSKGNGKYRMPGGSPQNSEG